MIGTEKLFTPNKFFPEQKFYIGRPEHKQPTQSETPKAATSPEKQPSKLGILILAIVTIWLYSLGINESSQTVSRAITKEVYTEYNIAQHTDRVGILSR